MNYKEHYERLKNELKQADIDWHNWSCKNIGNYNYIAMGNYIVNPINWDIFTPNKHKMFGFHMNELIIDSEDSSFRYLGNKLDDTFKFNYFSSDGMYGYNIHFKNLNEMVDYFKYEIQNEYCNGTSLYIDFTKSRHKDFFEDMIIEDK